MSASKATAIAHPNIALVKYWGKRDPALNLPHQSSLSITLAPLSITATVELGGSSEGVVIDGKIAEAAEHSRVEKLIAPLAAGRKVRVETKGNFPRASGLASSAAAFAALALATRKAAGLEESFQEASILARRGSGSACRSIQGGVCVWHKGARPDGLDSFATQLFPESHWPSLRLLVVVMSTEEKAVSSREGMRRTVETSPYYSAWPALAEADVQAASALVARRELPALGELSERNAWRMHAIALGASPPLCYISPRTLGLIQELSAARRAGLEAWFTLDAGPNPVLLTQASQEEAAAELARRCGALEVLRCEAGGDARLLDAHLF